MKKINEITEEQEKINTEIFSHMANPRNYGEMNDAHGVGKCLNDITEEFLMAFIKVNDENILEDISYGCNANQDTSLCGSIFTEMVKGDTLDNAIESLKLMEQKILDVPISQKINSSMILHAFRAALINRENRMNGMDEDIFTISLDLDRE